VIILRAGFLIATLLTCAHAHAFFPQWVRGTSADAPDASAIRAEDFDGDGRPELLVRFSTGALSIAFVQQDGTPGAPVLLDAGVYGDAIPADVDGDGDRDVLAVRGSSVVVFPAKGDGTFEAPVVTATVFTYAALATADFNGDGKLDVALVSRTSDVIVFMTGNGTGAFVEAQVVTTPGNISHVAAGDFDLDGKSDVVALNSEPVRYDLLYGRGDVSFSSSSIPAAATWSSDFRSADLDQDGDLDLLSCQFAPNTVTVVLNLGARTFAAPATYDAFETPPSPSPGNPTALAIGEFTGDAILDVVVTLTNHVRLATFTGTGNGALGNVDYASVRPVSQWPDPRPHFQRSLAPGDFNEDGRMDIALVHDQPDSIVVFANAAGDSRMTLRARNATISAGDRATFLVSFRNAPGFSAPQDAPAPAPSGTVTLKSGDATIATGTFVGTEATIDAPALPAGVHEITATFEGDASYRAMEIGSVTQRVVVQKTTTTLTGPAGEIVYGEAWSVQAAVTSEIAAPIGGKICFGEIHLSCDAAPVMQFRGTGSAPGTYTFVAEYQGDDVHPRSRSATFTQVVRKSPTTTTVEPPALALYGERPVLFARVSAPYTSVHGGTLSIYEGTTLLVNGTQLPVLAPGTYYLHVRYSGTENFARSESGVVTYTVLPNTGLVLDATAREGTIRLQWRHATMQRLEYTIERRIGAGPWSVVAKNVELSYVVHDVAPDVVYSFRILAHQTAANLVATSNVEVAMLTRFTDDPLTRTTAVKAQHLRELVDAINRIRAAGSLAPVVLDVRAGAIIRAAHVASLAEALDDARAAIGATWWSPSPRPAAGAPVLLRDVQALRDALR
jgi:hypothetical protein